MSDDNVNSSSLDQDIDTKDKLSPIASEKYKKEEGRLIASERGSIEGSKPSPRKSWTIAEIERVINNEVMPATTQKLGRFGIDLSRRNDFRLKDLTGRLGFQVRRDFAKEINSGPINRRLRASDIQSHTMRMVTANASLGMYQFHKTQTLPFMRKSLALDYERTNLLKKVVRGITGLEKALVSKLEAIKMNTAAIVPTKKSRLTKIREAIQEKINDRVATNFANVTLAGYDAQYKKYVSPTLVRIQNRLTTKGRTGGINGATGVISSRLNELRHSVAKAGQKEGKNPSFFNKLASNILTGAVKATQSAKLPQRLSSLIAKPLSYATDTLSKVQPFEATGTQKAINTLDRDLNRDLGHASPPGLSSFGGEDGALLRFLRRNKKEEDVYRKTLLEHVKAIRYHLVPNKKHWGGTKTPLPKALKVPTSISHHQVMAAPARLALPNVVHAKILPVIRKPKPVVHHEEDLKHPKPSLLTTLFGKLSERLGKIDKSLTTDRKLKTLADKAQAKQKALMDRLVQRAKVRKGSYEDLQEQKQKGFIPWERMGRYGGMFGGAAAEGVIDEQGHAPPPTAPNDPTGIPSIGALGLMGLGVAGKNLLKFGWRGSKFAGKYGWRLGKAVTPSLLRGGAKTAGLLGRFGLREVKGIGRVGARGAAAAGGASAGMIGRLLGKSIKGVPLLSLLLEGADYADGERAINWRNLAKSGLALGGGALGGLGGGLLTAGMGGEFVGGIGGYAAGRKLGDALLGSDDVTNKPEPKDPKKPAAPNLFERFRNLTAWQPEFIRKKALLPRLKDALSVGVSNPNEKSRATRFGEAVRYGLTPEGMKKYFDKTVNGTRYSNGEYAPHTSLLNYARQGITTTTPIGFGIGASSAIMGWGSSTDKANDPKSPFYGFVSLVLDAYGVKNRSLYSYLHSLELSQDKVNHSQAKPFDDSDMAYMSGRFGLDAKSKDAVNYFKLWYKRRFIPALTLINNVLKSHKLTLSGVMGADDKTLQVLNTALKKEIAGSDLKTLGLEPSAQAYNKYAKIGSKPPDNLSGSSVVSSQPYDPRNPKNIPNTNGQGGSESYFSKFTSLFSNAAGGLFGTANSQPAPATRNNAQIVKGSVKDQPQFKAAYAKLPPNLKKLIDNSKTLQFVLWSTAVQHGGDAAALIFQRDYASNLDEKSYIRSIYQDRSTKFSNLGSMDRIEAIQHLGEEQKFAEGIRSGMSNPDVATMGREISNVINPSGNSNLGYDPSTLKVEKPKGTMGERAKDALMYLMKKGYTKFAAAGIVGNLQEESALNPHGPAGDSGRAIGLGQWHPDRQRNIAQALGKSIPQMNFHEQLDAVDWELRNGKGTPTGRPIISELNAAKDAATASRIFMQKFEAPKDRAAGGPNDRARARNAMGALQLIGDSPTPAANNNASSPSPTAAKPAAKTSTPAVKQPAKKTVAQAWMDADLSKLTKPMDSHGSSLDEHTKALRDHTAALLKPQGKTAAGNNPQQNNFFSPIINAAKDAGNFVTMSMAKTPIATGDR